MNRDRDYVKITFHDNGTGIPPGEVGKIMKPFYSSKPNGQGTGLGLSISQSIIIDYRGNMSIDSVDGEYTKVIIHFPVKKR